MKFGAPIVFYDDGDVSRSNFTAPTLRGQEVQGQTRYGVAFREKKQRYYESMMVRLYLYHGSRADPSVQTPFGDRTVVFDYDTGTSNDGSTSYKVLPRGENATPIRTFGNESAARQFVEEEGSAQIGGIGSFPRETVSALEHYRLVATTDTSAYASGQYQRTVLRESRSLGLRPSLLQQTQPQWVKTFEKVPGATVEGEGADPNETVTATVRMRVPEGGSGGNASSFTYEQQTTANEDGEFEFTVPYSTTGYDQYGPENGYTNVSVRATGAYTVTGEVETNESSYIVRNQGTFNVSEGLVNGDRDGTASVTLEEEVLRAPEGAQEGSENNTTDGSENSSSLPAEFDSLEELSATADAGLATGGWVNGSDATGELTPAIRAPTRRTVTP